VTFAVGLVSLRAVGRTEILWISCGVLVLLLYKMLGRELADLVSTTASRAHVAELLRFAQLRRDWSGELDLPEQSGVPRRHVVRVLEWGDQIAREAGLIAVGPRSSPDVSVPRATEPEA
jgi:hypothetical protein